jgi:cysteine desulfurase
MAANNEIGTLHPIAEIGALCKQKGVLFHTDATQAPGKVPLDVEAQHVDLMSISAHKFYGPKGVGALYVRDGLTLPALFDAGHQERERRPGTENVIGIVGMGAAAGLARERLAEDRARVAALCTQLEAGLASIPDTVIHAGDAPRVGNTVSVGFHGALGEAVVAALDLAGFAASTGAACTSGSVDPSPVLLGIGLPPERAVEAVRFSLGRGNDAAQVQALLAALPEIIARARRFR